MECAVEHAFKVHHLVPSQDLDRHNKRVGQQVLRMQITRYQRYACKQLHMHHYTRKGMVKYNLACCGNSSLHAYTQMALAVHPPQVSACEDASSCSSMAEAGIAPGRPCRGRRGRRRHRTRTRKAGRRGAPQPRAARARGSAARGTACPTGPGRTRPAACPVRANPHQLYGQVQVVPGQPLVLCPPTHINYMDRSRSYQASRLSWARQPMSVMAAEQVFVLGKAGQPCARAPSTRLL